MRDLRGALSCVALVALASGVACGPAKPAETAGHEDESAGGASGGATKTPTADSDSPPVPPPPRSATPPPPATSSGVPYDKESVEIGLKRAARQVKANCGATTGEDGKATGPWGQTTVTVKLGHNGHSQGATIAPPYDGKPVGKCAVQAFAILTYPPFAGADTTVDWPIEMVAPAGAH